MIVEPLGKLARTHTCGELTAAHVGQDVVLLGWVHRVRDLGGVLFFDSAGPSRHHSGRRPRCDARGGGQAPAARVRRRHHRPRRRARQGSDQSEAEDRRDRNRRARDPAAERREDAAVPDQRRDGDFGRDAPPLPLPRPAPAAAAAEHDPAAQDGVRGAPVLRRAGLPRDRDADPDQVDAGRRARLSGAEPRPPGRVLRAAAIAADLQADPDDLGDGPLLPDREVLPRRGPARRSAARVHAGGPRDLVRDRRTWCSRSSNR